MKPKLIQQQTLQWKMNQSLMQSINILQFSSLELAEYINQISKENPLIEEVNYDYDWEKYHRTHSTQPAIGEINSAEQTMYEQLKKQLISIKFDKKLRHVIDYGIDSLNEDGYLEVERDVWAEDCRTSVETVEEALHVIQALEPTGIGARTLTECILLQLKEMGIHYSFAEDLFESHLEWIAEEDAVSIAEHYQTTTAIAEEVIDHIKLCHPKPGQLLDTEPPEYIIPEASIYKEDGAWKIKFYKWASPTIRLNTEYEKLTEIGKDATAFLKEKYKQVDLLKQAIGFRSNTLESIIQIIVEKQYAFFEEGVVMLQPLTLREIANDLAIHISTVSRAINQKYVQTPHGVLPIKFFLQSGARQSNGKGTASIAIKHLLIQLIDKEEKSKPLSDQVLRNILEEEFGIKIARRTVMKYREQLQIPSSMKRRRK
ncbi:RNA polymerase factor sigma-54 [Oceanobacillus halophilus]|uniref:RNA polymerase sigma-54 factor n=1 Tax=Oceanobacillus halophilus TaxID=930130 RepID=A0A495A6S3_9BACI|nr:RNA polymerase factor sigma-54 [Oceanobacillus halophilus]RKQ35542.1 RNA polymerase sigma-54 factor [Oceanobacillus halophilus]